MDRKEICLIVTLIILFSSLITGCTAIKDRKFINQFSNLVKEGNYKGAHLLYIETKAQNDGVFDENTIEELKGIIDRKTDEIKQLALNRTLAFEDSLSQLDALRSLGISDDKIDVQKEYIQKLQESDNAYNAGKKAMEENQYYEALEYFNNVIEDDIFYDEAQNLFNKTYALLRDTALRDADNHFNDGDYDLAIECIDRFLGYAINDETEANSKKELYIKALEEEKIRLQDCHGNSNQNLMNYTRTCKQDGWVYYTVSQPDGSAILCKEKPDGTGQQVINIEGAKNFQSINVVGRWIYFINNLSTVEGYGFLSHVIPDMKLYRVKTDGSQLTKLSNDNIENIHVVGEWIYYINIDDNYRIYKMKIDGSEKTQLNNDRSSSISIVDDWIYYRDRVEYDEPCNIYRMKRDGTSKQTIMTTKNIFAMFVENQELYYSTTDYPNEIFCVNLDGLNKKRIVKSTDPFFSADNGYVYFTKFEYGLYRVKIDGSDENRISVDDPFHISIIDDWLYYSTLSGDFRLKNDGSTREKLSID